jgi:response regulator RpfG family c-di-GMP phosphodiesterase/HAMP domain-containing protein
MRLTSSFLRSKVARRIFSLFILCALLPISALAILSYQQVTKQLSQQRRVRLIQFSKSFGMSIHERLQFLDMELSTIASSPPSGRVFETPLRLAEDFSERFESLAIVGPDGKARPVFGVPKRLPKLSAEEMQHLGEGKPVVASLVDPEQPAVILISLLVDARRPAAGLLVGEVKPAWLWSEETLIGMASTCVLDSGRRLIFCSSGTPAEFFDRALPQVTGGVAGQFEWSDDQETYLAGHWSVFLRPRFFTPQWTVVVSESKSDALRPVETFRQVFPGVLFLALLVVILLSLILIRRTHVPLEKLQEGTRQIARQNFAARVEIASRDEYQELGNSFNAMASRLGQQFQTLTAIDEIDRAILSSLDKERIADTVRVRMRELVPCEAVGVTLVVYPTQRQARTKVARQGSREVGSIHNCSLSTEELATLEKNRSTLLLYGSAHLPSYLSAWAGQQVQSYLILPLFLNEELLGIISLKDPVLRAETPEDLLYIRRVADQVAVALSNARLIENLHQLHWGTLTALARAIDTKSPWTAGHSERVTQMAVRIGQAMGLSRKELEILHRGGLVHDIGKIGTPATILNKPGKLDEAEFQQMREHVRMGARILEPIPGFDEILPIVLHHHEWYDGSGYPEKLKGEAISLHGRIFAIADCFDALISDRPYRPGWARDKVLEYIRGKAGTQFDPRVVEVFLRMMAEEQEPSPQPQEAPAVVS